MCCGAACTALIWILASVEHSSLGFTAVIMEINWALWITRTDNNMWEVNSKFLDIKEKMQKVHNIEDIKTVIMLKKHNILGIHS